MRFCILTAIFAAAIAAAAAGKCPVVTAATSASGKWGDGIADNPMLSNCWGNCAAYARGGRCKSEEYIVGWCVYTSRGKSCLKKDKRIVSANSSTRCGALKLRPDTTYNP